MLQLLEERNRLIDLLAQKPEFGGGKVADRRALIEQAGLKRFLGGIDLEGIPRTVASNLISHLETCDYLSERPTHHALGALLMHLLDIGESGMEEATFIAAVIVKHTLINDPQTIHKLRTHYRLTEATIDTSKVPASSTSSGMATKRKLWNIPFADSRYFIGRELVLERLFRLLQTQHKVALTGLGGIGKTHTAIHYAHQHREEYQALFWLEGDSEVALTRSFAGLAVLLGFPDTKEQATHIVKNWLATNKDHLLIIDNADDTLSLVDSLLPPAYQGKLLITTRAHSAMPFAESVNLPKMDVTESIKLLQKRAGLTSLNDDEEKAAKELIAELDGLPLAIDQAAAYINETQCSIVSYLKLYKVDALRLLKERGLITMGNHPDPVAATWILSFAKCSPAAVELLNYCAFLHPDKIPEDIFTKGANTLSATLSPIVADPFEFNKIISETLKYSLLNRAQGCFSIHRLVQRVLQDNIQEEKRKSLVTQIVNAVGLAFKDGNEYSHWLNYRDSCEQLLPCAQCCKELINEYQLETDDVANLLDKVAIYLHHQGDYAKALPRYQRALAIREKVLGAEHPDVATSLNNLAVLYQDQGDYAKALPRYQRALAIREKVLGAEHHYVAASLSGLAGLYKAHGDYTQALSLYQRALAINEKVLDAEHHHVAASLNNLSLLYHVQGDYAQALPLCQRALAISEKVLGAEHPHVAASLNNLASLYEDQGDYAKALSLYQRALAIREKVLGVEHPDVANSLNNLASLYQDQGDYAKSLPLYQRALAIREKVLGAEHPHVATSLNNLASLYQDQGDYDQALPLYQRALAIREKVLGTEHYDVVSSLNDLASLYKDQGNYAQALPLCQRALVIVEKVLGKDHPNTCTVLANYNSLLDEIKRK